MARSSAADKRSGGLRQPLLGGANRTDSTPAAAANDSNEVDLEQGPAEAPQTASVWRLLREARPEALTLTIATLCLLIGSLASLAVPKIAGGLIDACTQAASGTVTPAQAQATLNNLLVEVMGVLLVGGLFSGIRAYMFNAAAERVMCRLRVQLFSKEVGFFDRTPVGELTNRLSEDTRSMKDAATTSISMALRSLVTVILGATMMFLTSWRLALLTCATLPFMLLQFRAFARLNKKYVTSQLAAAAAASATAQEVLSGIRTVKSFAKEQQTINTYAGAAGDILKWGLKSSVASGVFTGVSLPFAYGCLMLVLWYGAVLVLQGAITLGDLNAFMLYAIYVAGSAGGLAGTAASVIAAVGGGKRVFQLLDRTPQLPPSGNEKPTGSPAGAALEFKDVSFAYPSRPTAWVLRNFSLEVQPGQSVALVGASGGGKSSVCRLIQRFYDPSSGSIVLDGVALPQIDRVFLHQSVAMVAQEPLVFADTIKNNIMFGVHRSVSQAEVEAAAVAAHAHDFITALPKGYDSRVGEQGVTLSGGQKQRLAIARALLCSPRLLLLDEATSALDAESEAQVQQALAEASRGRTVLVIAHRLSTVSGADCVAVVAQGQIIESGTHARLMTGGGAYSQLVQRQVFTGGAAGEGVGSSSFSATITAGGPAAAAGEIVAAGGNAAAAAGGENATAGGAAEGAIGASNEQGQPAAAGGSRVVQEEADSGHAVTDTTASEVLPASAAAVVDAVTATATAADLGVSGPSSEPPSSTAADVASSSARPAQQQQQQQPEAGSGAPDSTVAAAPTNSGNGVLSAAGGPAGGSANAASGAGGGGGGRAGKKGGGKGGRRKK